MLDYIVPIITAAVMAHNFTSVPPEISTPIPEATYKDSYSVNVTGQADSRVFVNGIEVANLGDDGRTYIYLDTSGEYGTTKEFQITFKNKNGLETEALTFSIDKVQAITSRYKAIKLLRQASFSSREEEIDEVIMSGEEAWIDTQLNIVGDLDNLNDTKYGYLESLTRFLNKNDPQTYPESLFLDPFSGYPETKDGLRFRIFTDSIWWEKSLHNEDQLRQRVAYALSQLLVTSRVGGPYDNRGESAAHYYDILVKHAFGNYRDLLKDVTMSAPMAYYLTYLASSKENNETGTAPDENYARELMQLFSVGLYELNNDGTKQYNAKGFPIPIYTQDDVSEMAKVFTGWALSSTNYDYFRNSKYTDIYTYAHSFILPIRNFEEYHDFGEKTVLGQTIAADLSPEQDIDRALDILMANSNIAPHVCRELINRLVTSNPTPAYMGRVVAKFNDNGNGVKGDLKATVRAILTDDEAREETTSNSYGKVDEYTLLISHYLSALDVKPYPNFQYTNSSGTYTTAMKDVYWMRENDVLQAESVFNFYSPEYIPNDSDFSTTALVAPEFEQRTDNKLINFANNIEFIFKRTGVTDIIQQSNFHGVVINRDSYFEKLSMLVDGNNLLEFENLNVGTKEKISPEGEIAIGEFIDYVSYRLTGKLLPEDYKAQLIKQLITTNYYHSYIYFQAQNIVQGTIKAIILSPAFMVIK